MPQIYYFLYSKLNHLMAAVALVASALEPELVVA
jgi:hypothetical protein